MLNDKVNYVIHLYTLAGLGFSDEEYTARFGNADVKTFCQIFDRLSATGITDPAELYLFHFSTFPLLTFRFLNK